MMCGVKPTVGSNPTATASSKQPLTCEDAVSEAVWVLGRVRYVPDESTQRGCSARTRSSVIACSPKASFRSPILLAGRPTKGSPRQPERRTSRATSDEEVGPTAGSSDVPGNVRRRGRRGTELAGRPEGPRDQSHPRHHRRAPTQTRRRPHQQLPPPRRSAKSPSHRRRAFHTEATEHGPEQSERSGRHQGLRTLAGWSEKYPTSSCARACPSVRLSPPQPPARIGQPRSRPTGSVAVAVARARGPSCDLRSSGPIHPVRP